MKDLLRLVWCMETNKKLKGVKIWYNELFGYDDIIFLEGKWNWFFEYL